MYTYIYVKYIYSKYIISHVGKQTAWVAPAEFGPVPVPSLWFAAAIPGQMTNCPFTGGKDPALGLTYNWYSEFFPCQQLEVSKPTHAGFGGQDQKTAVNTKDTPAVNFDCCNSIPHLLNLFTQPY